VSRNRRNGGSIVRPRREQGSALVEFALISSILFVMLFGIIEFGLAFRDKLTVANASQGAARVGAAMGTDPASDWLVLESARQSLGGATDQSIVKFIAIFLADDNGDPTTGRINTYRYSPDSNPLTCDWNPCPDPANFTGYGGGWDPSIRDVSVDGGLDVLGVRIYFTRDWVTGGLLPLDDQACTVASSSECWIDTTLMRLEPKT
jgi:hypothetical protein